MERAVRSRRSQALSLKPVPQFLEAFSRKESFGAGAEFMLFIIILLFVAVGCYADDTSGITSKVFEKTNMDERQSRESGEMNELV
jgi:hypothetical protein